MISLLGLIWILCGLLAYSDILAKEPHHVSTFRGRFLTRPLASRAYAASFIVLGPISLLSTVVAGILVFGCPFSHGFKL